MFSPGEFHGQKSLAGYSLWGLKELDTAEQLTLSVCYFVLYKGKIFSPLPQCSLQEQHTFLSTWSFFFCFPSIVQVRTFFFFLIYLTLLIVNRNVIKELLFLSGCICLEKIRRYTALSQVLFGDAWKFCQDRF